MKTVEVVAAIIIKNRKILCCQRSKDINYGGKWEFPGGKIEVGEEKEDALIREIKEELNARIDVKSFFMTIEQADIPILNNLKKINL